MISDTFLKNTKDKPPSKLLVEALPFVSYTTGRALDLGCGAFKDSVFLLENGFIVDAVDNAENVAAMVSQQDGLTFYQQSFSEFTFNEGRYDLVNAQFSLPFTSPDTFTEVWDKMVSSLPSGGVFVGQFFGPEDEFSDRPEMTFLDRQEVENLCASFTVRTFVESKRTGKTATGHDKFWHIFDVIGVKARK